MNIKLELTLEEAQAIVNILGQTPTSSGVFPLLMKIKEQAEAQIEAPPITEEK